MFLRGDSAVFAKNDISNDQNWVQETLPATINAIAIGDNGRQMVRNADMGIWAKDIISYGDWQTQVGPGNAAAIAVG